MTLPDIIDGKRRILVGHTLADPCGNILAVDQGVCTLFHRNSTELIGMSYLDITHPDDRSNNRGRVDALGKNQAPIILRKRYLRPDGAAVWCEAQVSRLDDGNDRGRLIGTLHHVCVKSILQTPRELWLAACRRSANLQRRRRELGDDLFSDFAWLLLLQLYLAEIEGRCADFEDLVIRTECRLDSVRRWLRVLEERKFVDSVELPGCAAQLTSTGIAKVEKLLDGTQAA